jgi:hypothetical protein
VRGEVIDGKVYRLVATQRFDVLLEESGIESIRVIEVEPTRRGNIAIVPIMSDEESVGPLDQLASQRGLSAGRTACDEDQERGVSALH